MTTWDHRPVPFAFQLSDWTLFSLSVPLQFRAIQLVDEVTAVDELLPPRDPLAPGSRGFMIRSVRVSKEQPVLSTQGGFLCYVPLQYQHCYIDLRLDFAAYKAKFSSKTRSTINRKIKKFSEHCGGRVIWKAYKSPAELHEFYRLARAVSMKTYQERLLGSGLPESDEFVREMETLAAGDQVRAYLLFDGEAPVSYLYCPVRDNTLIYGYLGYDPAYLKLSVGIVLQWLALEDIFDERRFLMFDFTEGQSEHKLLFATNVLSCAHVIFLTRTLQNRLLVRCHLGMARFSAWLGRTLDRLGLKVRVKRLLRFAGR